jgi:menaquinone-specific isochorismate synthase
MDPVEAVVSNPGGRLVTECLSVDVPGPLAFLRAMDGNPRGLWARGEEWVAHAGAIEVLRGDGPHRIGQILEEAAELYGPAREEEPRESIRFFGGFSFRTPHRAVGLWEGFPEALFHLPELELVGGPGGTWLRGRTVVRGDRYDARQRLRRRIEEVAELARGLPERPPGAPIPCERHATNPGLWRSAVEDALEAIAAGTVSKVVLARTLDVLAESDLDPLRVVEYLWSENRGAHVFLFEPSPGHLMVGAAPETVATLHRGSFHATAVAGSIAHGETPAETRALAGRLLASAKDREEHRIALDDMVDRLRPMAEEVEAQPEPHVLTLARIQHLETEIRARMPEGSHVLEVLEALHPTPAVCGLPRDAALDFLHREEPFERGWYAGPVGWFDGDGNGVFAPALRCAVARGREWRLFAGAGLVAASEPALEWEETGIKFEPVLRALQASGAR